MQPDAMMEMFKSLKLHGMAQALGAVSYTHLTLPTILRV